MVLLARVMDYARELGFEFVDADCTVACQQPKITPHRDAMRANLAMPWALTSKTWASPPLRPKSSVGRPGRGNRRLAVCLLQKTVKE